MKKITLLLAALLLAIICIVYMRCTKVNTDQPCGITSSNQQLFKDSNNKCYYVENNTGNHIYVDPSICNCY